MSDSHAAPITHGRDPARLSEKAIQLAHDFLSALFMGVRTAQIHDATNAAYSHALDRVHESAAALYSAVGAFDVKVVEQSVFINGVALRFQGKSFQAMRNLAVTLESRQMGGFRMAQAPTYDAMQRLISIFATGAKGNLESHRQLLQQAQIGVFGVQRLGDDNGAAKVDRGVFALHSYAKLILGLREHAAIIEHVRQHGDLEQLRPRIRVVRVIQHLAELCDDRLDLLLKLASNNSGATSEELTAANACVLSLALGHALGLHRRDLGDLGMAALFSELGRQVMPSADTSREARNAAALASLLSESGVGQGLYTRAMVLTEQVLRPHASLEGMRRAHPFSRLVRVALAYCRLISGLELADGATYSPPEAVQTLRADRSGWLDPRLVDLLANLLRVFPRGTPVVLDSGHPALVAETNTEVFDSPMVRVAGNPPSVLDLDPRRQPPTRVAFTQQFLGTEPVQGGVVTSAPQATSADLGDGLQALPATPEGVMVPAQPPTQQPSLPSLDSLARQGPPPATTPKQVQPQSSPAPHLVDDLMPPPAAPPPAATEPHIDILEPEIGEEDLRSTTPSGTVPPSAYSESAPNRLIGTYLAGKYRILRKIGEGGMGAVYLANQEPIDRKVAVKVLLSSLAGDEVAVKRFEREAKTISRMRHPNTVTIYDSGKTTANELYIVMEHLEGETLADLIHREGAVPADRAARIIRQACASLSEAHEAGIVHRDLKPDNVFLTRLGNEKDWVKVLDFGLAKLADNEQTARITQQGKVFGTPRYMSPEQAQGLTLDGRSDLYTLGVVLHELLTGQSLFKAETMVALLVKHISEPPPLLFSVRPDLHFDPRLERVVQRALTKELDQRLPSMDAFASALEPFAYPAADARAQAPAHRPLPQPGLRTPGDSPTEADNGELDGLLSEFLRDLTPLDHLAEGSSNPFAGYTPDGMDDGTDK